jgi:pimeloyl-ACP methyl ester carboxylesterase
MRFAGVACAAALATASALAHVTAASAAARDRFATADGARVHYRIDGDAARTVVFVHGWACDGSFWREQIPAIVARGSRAIAVDLPGHGRSDHPDVAYTPERLARGVEAVLRQERDSGPVLVGHSMGGLVIRYVAEHVPGARGLVVVDSRSVLFGEGNSDAAQRAAFADALRRDATDKTFRDYLPTFFVDATPAAVREEIAAKMVKTNRRVAASAYEGMGTAKQWSASPTSIPTLALYGKSGDAGTETALRRQFTQLQYVRWPDPIGHFLMLERPQVFNDALVAFLDGL